MKVYKYITNCCSMQYAVPEFESIKPILERLYGKKITLYKVKNRICRETAVYYTLNDDEDEKNEKLMDSYKMIDALAKKEREADDCLRMIEVHTGSIGQSKQDMNESLIAIMNICRKFFGEE